MFGQRLLITGATGFVGKAILSEALVRGFEVCLLVRDINRYKSSNNNNSLVVYPARASGVQKSFENFKPTAVIHLATCYGRNNEHRDEIFAVNYDFPTTLIRAAVANKVQKFLNADTFFIPSLGLEAGLRSYVESKKQFLDNASRFATNSDTRFINLKIFQAYGPGDRPEKFLPGLMAELKRHSTVALTEGHQLRDFVYVTDIASAFLAVAACPNQDLTTSEFEIGTGVGNTIRDIALLLKKKLKSCSELNFGELPYRENEIMSSIADIRALKNLGWAPEVPIQAGISRMLKAIDYEN